MPLTILEQYYNNLNNNNNDNDKNKNNAQLFLPGTVVLINLKPNYFFLVIFFAFLYCKDVNFSLNFYKNIQKHIKKCVILSSNKQLKDILTILATCCQGNQLEYVDNIGYMLSG